MPKAALSNPHSLDYLISRSGIVGRQILKAARFLYRMQVRLDPREGAPPGVLRRKPFLLIPVRTLEKATLLIFIYYVGGSLTRTDQQTLAGLTGIGEKQAYRLTLFNALLFGLPSAAVYFIVGEGAQWAGELHSLAAIPSWVVGNAARLGGAASLAVDIFRAADAALNRRCRAPFGLFPIAINLPTYARMLGRRLRTKRSASK
jgi:hypothetical protein